MSAPNPVAVIIVNYRTPELVAENLEALAAERAALPRLFAMVVDGGSADGSAARIAEFITRPDLRDWVCLRALDVNGGFGWANNQAIREILCVPSPPDYIYLLNPDAVVRPGAIKRLVEALDADAQAAAVGSRLVDHEGSLLGAAFRFPSAASEFARGADTAGINRLFGIMPLRLDPTERTRVDWVTGASVMFRAEALRQVGVFDEGFFLYFEEVDLMHRLHEAGWHVLHEPASAVVHVGGASTGVGVAGPPRPLPDYWYCSRLRYFARTRGRFGAALVNLCWLAGKSIWALRSMIGMAPSGRHPPHELSGLFRAGLWPLKHDVQPHGTSLDAGRSPPAWHTRA
ncbi:glycosyltransferase family 2 protein [Sphingomonas sp. MG17]|uniref:Glycosyltransferase family 2 protein n=1 Tax=Sphingomonas tagetis TaxID=2949092 RepID=A0A9X2HHA4_9SPHN|nr:glycosyltransferase family 2 protein [Sphingomonas tagetis]MCP3730823.1 glycosyltransferase family 2 protein [Sphingomonas tagetis]